MLHKCLRLSKLIEKYAQYLCISLYISCTQNVTNIKFLIMICTLKCLDVKYSVVCSFDIHKNKMN